MSERYLVEPKKSVFRDTPLTEEDFDDPRIEFSSKDQAEKWASEQDRLHSKPGSLTLHTAHPNDKSDVDAYLVFQPSGVWLPD